jgi:Protein of unknown function (DUF1501)
MFHHDRDTWLARRRGSASQQSSVRDDPSMAPVFSRRRLLQIGGLGGLGLNLPRLLAAQAQAAAAATGGASASPIKSCILLFYYGGPSHHDTWDMKLAAPREVRGDFAPISTSVPGMSVCEHLPRSARIMDKLAVIRSMHHPMRNHNAAAVEALCGRTPLKGDLELLANDPLTDFPCFGSAMSHVLPQDRLVPTSMALPHIMYNVVMLPGQTAGFLGSRHEPLRILRDPNAADFHVPELELPAGLTMADLEHRESLLGLVNAQSAATEARAADGSLDPYYERAFAILHSPEVRRSLDISQETAITRDRYGRTTHGQSVLLARRLVESGVRFVSVYDKVTNGLDNWDTHVNNFGRLKDQLLPPTDMAFSALVEDLAERGMLDSTLVVWIGEFGRTPRINKDGGRDHWPDCFSVCLAGGGVRGGSVYGASDKIGGRPEIDAVSPGDLAATIFWRFGVDPAQQIYDSAGRPYRLAEGEPIRRLFA